MIIWLFIALVLAGRLEGLSVEEKVGQLLMVHFNGSEVNEDAQKLLHEAHVGGFIFYNWSNGLKSKEQVSNLSSGLQKSNRSKHPLLLAVDQEGGRVNRLRDGFKHFPSQKDRAAASNASLETFTAEAMGGELKEVGINVNFAPVVDINTNPECNPLGDRVYGNDPKLVTEWAKAALKGYERVPILCSLKHFPGHGDVKQDSHEATPVLHKSKEELNSCEFYPYFHLAEAAPMIMTAHIILKAYDADHPATLSQKVLEGVLRNEMNYQGVIISDSLVMRGAGSGDYQETALKALQAGCDMVCLGGKLLNAASQDEITAQEAINIHRYLVDAVKKGELHIDDKVDRIVRMKSLFLCLFDRLRTGLTPETIDQISNKIFFNECGGKKEKLVWWNQGELFLSLGIGHFIWYPEKVKPAYDEGFKLYLQFLKEKQVSLPEWFPSFPPWNAREEWLQGQDKGELLQKWLLATLPLQGEFMIERLFHALKRILSQAPKNEFPLLIDNIEALALTPQGLFALVDYLNFKGEGLSTNEQYGGVRWGLYQVLQGVSPENPLSTFQETAKSLLEKRVKAAPAEKNEEKWLSGWKNRIDRY